MLVAQVSRDLLSYFVPTIYDESHLIDLALEQPFQTTYPPRQSVTKCLLCEVRLSHQNVEQNALEAAVIFCPLRKLTSSRRELIYSRMFLVEVPGGRGGQDIPAVPNADANDQSG